MSFNRKKMLLSWLCAGYMLGIHDGKMALWMDEDPQPVHVFDLKETSLPSADRLLLRRGIRAETDAQLWAILEDYL